MKPSINQVALNDYCTGCGACAIICPQEAIEMVFDEEGFIQPEILGDRCDDCGRCLAVCPARSPRFDLNPVPDLYAAPAALFSSRTLEELFVDLGWAVAEKSHWPDQVETDPRPLLESIRRRLQQGEKVVFSASPCRVAGLKAAFGSHGNHLLTIDQTCSGVVSEKIYDLCRKNDSEHDCFLTITGRNLAWRVSCGQCPYARLPRQADLTCGRLAGERSFLAVNSQAGALALKSIRAKIEDLVPIEMTEVFGDRPYVTTPPRLHRNRRLFFEQAENWPISENITYNLDGLCDCLVFNFWHGTNYGGILTGFALQESLKMIGAKPRLAACYVENGHWGSFAERFASRYLAMTYRCSSAAEVDSLNRLTDTFIVGSDQVWRHEFSRRYNDVYFLEFVEPDKKKLACAVSFGLDHFDGDQETVARLRPLVRAFDDITVREVSGIDICRDVFGTKAALLPDPVFGLNVDQYLALAAVSQRKDKNYVAFYGDINQPLNRCAAEWVSEEMNLPIVYLDSVEVVDWLHLVKNCDFLVTESFHACCFALLFNRPFLFCETPHFKSASRLSTLFKYFDIKDRWVTSDSQWPNLNHLIEGIDFNAVNLVATKQRAKVRRWLIRALSTTKNSSLF